MPLVINAPPNPMDTLATMANWVSSNARSLDVAALAFIEDLRAQSTAADFTAIGTPDALGYAEWNYDAELNTLMNLRPSGVALDLTQVSADTDALKALATPATPVLDLPTAAIPSLDAERPVITLPNLPGTDVGTAPQDAPDLEQLVTPDAPVVTMPSVPTFEELHLPESPTFTIPAFASEMPQNLLSAPTNNFAYVDPGYTSQLRDPIIAKLLHDLESGSYGIEPSDEAALWTRARDRAEAAGRLSIAEVHKRAASMSFPMPQGALYADLERARQELQAKLSEVNRDIALKRADMYVEGRKFTYQQVQQLEQLSISLYNAIQERSLNFARASVEVGIAVFDATVRNYNAQLEAHKVEATVFETRIRAELAKAELFKAQIQAESLRGEFNRLKADLYQSQLNGIQSAVNLYKTRIEAVNALSEVQRSKIEVFKARISAYATRVQAKAAEYDMYRSAVQGETAKLEIYKTDIQAHEAKLRGEELRTKVLVQGNEARIAQFNGAVAQYAAQLSGLSKTVDARLATSDIGIKAAAINVSGYRALSDAILAGVQTKRDMRRLNNDWSIAVLNSQVEKARMMLEELKLTVNTRSEIDKHGAKLYIDPMTATLAALNGLSVATATV